jgi:alanine racemase
VVAPGRSDPWLEVEAAAIRHNAREVYRLCGGRPILAVVKNNAYGLGLTTVGPILDQLDEVMGLAVVKTDQALALRDAEVMKPVLLMGLFAEQDVAELVVRRIELAPYTDGVDRTLARLAARLDRRIPVHPYIDTGMGRLGMSFRRAPDWIAALAAAEGVEIRSTFTAFTEEDDFDPAQLSRFLRVAAETRERGVDPGRLHIASSHGLFFRPDSYLDMVRPGLVLYGAYPAGARSSRGADLRPAFRLRARVVRVERLEPGDGVSYGRSYVAERPTWTATLPVGHADGYPRRAVDGCEVLIGEQTYPVIGAVSASHTIIELGDAKTAEVGDIATLIGPDRASIHPNAVAERCGTSVYDVLMHLSARLPKELV